MKTHPAVLRAPLLVALCTFVFTTSACESTPSTGADAEVDGLISVEPPTCAWGEEAEALPYPEGQVQTRLEGQSQNRSTTCTQQTSAGGPEKIFRLRVSERSVVTIEALSDINTVVAIRTACDQPLTEIACGASGLAAPINPPVSDAGFFPSPFPPVAADAAVPLFAVTANPTDGAVQRVLEPGVYFVLIDQEEPFGVGGDVTVRVSSKPLPPHATCTQALAVSSSTQITTEPFDFASSPAPNCGPQPVERAYFYSITIPSGHQLSVRATAVSGDRPWQPIMQLHGTCDASMCLETDMQSDAIFGIASRDLLYINNGPTDAVVILSVGPDTNVAQARARLDISVRQPQPNGICQAALPVVDGATLLAQDLADGSLTPAPCGFFGNMSTLYYKATLLPQQQLLATVSSQGGSGFMTSVSSSCAVNSCLQSDSSPQARYTNSTGEKRDVVIAVSGFNGNGNGRFILNISMPLPPAAVELVTEGPIVLRETGTSASFRIRLTSPPSSTVTVPLTSQKPGEATVFPASVTFTPEDFFALRTVTLKGVDDALADGNQKFAIEVGKPQSTDPRYASLPPKELAVSNLDDEPGVSFAGGPLRTAENGRKSRFTVWLNAKPAHPVQLKVSSSAPREATAAPAELTFTPSDWDKPQTVTVTGVADSAMDGPQPFVVTVDGSTSADPRWVGVPPLSLAGINKERAWEDVPGKALPVAASCGSLGDREQRVAVDEAGTLYVALLCDQSIFGADGGFSGTRQAVVLSSSDGGRNFGAPVVVQASDVQTISIAAGREGQVYLSVKTFAENQFFHSKDAGRTWSQPRAIAPGQSAPAEVVAVNDAVLLWRQDGGNVTWWRNENAAEGAFEGPLNLISDKGLRMVGDANGEDVWQIETPTASSGAAWKSTDEGKTFTKVIGTLRADFNLTHISVGSGQLWGAGLGLVRAPLAMATSARATVVDAGIVSVLSLAADEEGGVSLVENNANVRARHFNKDGQEDQQPRTVTSNAFAATAANLGYGGFAYLTAAGTPPVFGVVAWEP